MHHTLTEFIKHTDGKQVEPRGCTPLFRRTAIATHRYSDAPLFRRLTLILTLTLTTPTLMPNLNP